MDRGDRRARSILLTLLALSVACADEPGVEQPTEWHQEAGYRWRDLALADTLGQGFTALPPARTGIEFANRLTSDQTYENQMRANGSGVAAGDVDGDGRVDLYFARLDGSNALYRNMGGWRFEEITQMAGVGADDRFSTGATFADVDGDGDLDLLITALGGPNAQFRNDGSGRFVDVTVEAGLQSDRGSMSLALADVDGDGDLDLYVTNYKVSTLADIRSPEELSFERTLRKDGDEWTVLPEFEEHYTLMRIAGELIRFEVGEPDLFYLNDGTGRFRPVSFTGGRFLDASGAALEVAPREWSLSARFRDVDGDGDPDLYVCNDLLSPDHFWINDGAGTFRAAEPLALRSTSGSSMAVDFADVDLDGNVDFFTADMLSLDPRLRKTQIPVAEIVPGTPGEIENRQQKHRNVLSMSRGDGSFAEVGAYLGLAASEWTWSSLFTDVDLDGDEDLLIANGHLWNVMDGDAERLGQGAVIEDVRRIRDLYPQLRARNLAFRNDRDAGFTEVGESWGFGTGDDISHGMALADLDGDGDHDVIVNRLGEPAAVLRNDGGARRVAVRLVGRAPNTRAVGARLRLLGGAVPEQLREIAAGGGYLSGSDVLQSFAAADSPSMSLVVDWRSGGRTIIDSVAPNRLYEISEAVAGAPEATPRTPEQPPPPGRSVLFEDRSEILSHVHTENTFDDFRRQPLLPNRLSQLGPGVGWADLDGDGDPDLVVASGRGGKAAWLRNEGGRFDPMPLFPDDHPVAFDQTTVLPLPTSVGVELLIGQSNWEAADPDEAQGAAAVLRTWTGRRALEAPAEAIPGGYSGTGPLAAADYDRDGDLDLFVGGRAVPGVYPSPASSRLFRRVGDAYELDEAASAPFDGIGLVSSALFSDIDGDADQDLVLAQDWGRIRVFRNQEGRFEDVTRQVGLDETHGRWNGVTTGDFDADGRPDILATGWGENTELGREVRTVVAYYGDFDNNGTVDMVAAAQDERLGGAAPLVSYRRLMTAIPQVRSRIRSYAEYADATVDAVIGPQLEGIPTVRFDGLAHLLLLNRGDRFEIAKLPAEAQLAPAFGAAIADFDGDGREDVFLAQNFFGTDPETPRLDAGRGLLMLGDGTGGFLPIAGQRSGIEVYGEGRGAAVADYDADGRADLVVTQNGAATRLYRNRGGDPGLRVRLIGSPENPWAIGAGMRILYEAGAGPLREVRAGAGYWSHDDPVQLLGLAETPRGLWVRWPDGVEQELTIGAERDLIVTRADR